MSYHFNIFILKRGMKTMTIICRLLPCMLVALFISPEENNGLETSCTDGLGLTYILPMFAECKEKQHPSGRMVQTIPKLVPVSVECVESSRRDTNLKIQRGYRICKFPDCMREPCQYGWCEETLLSYDCHCHSGFGGKSCSEINSTVTALTMTTITTSSTNSSQTSFLSTRNAQASLLIDIKECYTLVNGADYRGEVSITRNNKTCQNWTTQVPHIHSRTPMVFPDAGLGDHNFCRNPDGEDFAWCYTTSPSTRWEYCNIGTPQDECTPDSN